MTRHIHNPSRMSLLWGLGARRRLRNTSVMLTGSDRGEMILPNSNRMYSHWVCPLTTPRLSSVKKTFGLGLA
jgi:hypothetical protein